MRFYVLLLLACCCGCGGAIDSGDYRDEVAVDLAVATMVESPLPTPTPGKCERCGGSGWIGHGDGHRTPCPDCNGSSGNEYTGPLDTIRDAKELIRKANRAVERGNAILDAVERDGKVTVDVRLPNRGYMCEGGACCQTCPVTCEADDECESCPFDATRVQRQDEQAENTEEACQSCRGGTFRRPRLLWRWQR